jgi:outer membrane receptor for monomeric catechols
VDIVQGAAGATEVELATLGITLDTVRVTAQRVYASQRLTDFDRRLKMRTGTGHLIDATEIERRRPLVLTDLLRTIPGVQVLPGRRSGDDVYMRGGMAILGSGLCRPDLYVDGVRVVNDPLFPFNSMAPMSEIRAVEVYPHAALVPAELQTLNGCGVIVVWTGARGKG